MAALVLSKDTRFSGQLWFLLCKAAQAGTGLPHWDQLHSLSTQGPPQTPFPGKSPHFSLSPPFHHNAFCHLPFWAGLQIPVLHHAEVLKGSPVNSTWLKMLIHISLSKISPQIIMPWDNLQQQQFSVTLSTELQIPPSSKTSQTRENWLLCHTERGQPPLHTTQSQESLQHSSEGLHSPLLFMKPCRTSSGDSKISNTQCRQCCWAFSCADMKLRPSEDGGSVYDSLTTCNQTNLQEDDLKWV